MKADGAQVRATMRLQLHRAFGFADAAAQVDYAAGLGISHLYASPILGARAGSMHGYDVIDATRVNPELGGEDGLRALVARLREHGMGLIVDIVPNHMAVGRDDNAWWLDTLEWGADSRYARFFDIDWDVPDLALRGRISAPFLGKPYGEALADGELRLDFDAQDGRFSLRYYEHRFPLAPRLYAPLLRAGGDALAAPSRRFREALARRGRAARWSAFADACRDLAAASGDAAIADAISALLARYNASDDRTQLHRLLERQHWRLAWWRTAADEINWRRFFDVIDLAGMRIEEPAVFEATHATVFRLFAEGLIDGVRVDHIDGLADPRAYCRKLRARLTQLAAQRPAGLPDEPAYFVVEKILAPHEALPVDWRTDGTSGYVFMNDVGAVLHDGAGQPALAALWRRFTGHSGDFEIEARSARRRIPQELFAADLEACARALHRIARADTMQRDWSLAAIRRVLVELLVHFPVYRTYADARGRSAADAAIMHDVCASARSSCRRGEEALVDQVDRWLGAEPPQGAATAGERRMRLAAIARFQQLTSPVAAKSIEDTAFYRYGVLVSRNEVGADPAQFAIDPARFHEHCAVRRARFPRAMLATATHDHKRGEDVRARLAVLSELPQEWERTVNRWQQDNAPLKAGLDGPDPTDEYILYQMLVGAWPLTLEPLDGAGITAFRERLDAWQRKAVREAKRRSGWVEPNLPYEDACSTFLQRITTNHRFIADLHSFVDTIALPGAINGLAQTTLKLTTPGIPDIYQGCEFWDFSLVDPDNRRPVDYAARRAALASAETDAALLAGWRDGRLKQRLIARILALRAESALCFAHGSHRGLVADGTHASHLLGFAREHPHGSVLVIVPRHPSALFAGTPTASGDPARWLDTALRLPKSLCGRQWFDAVSGRTLRLAAQFTPARDLRDWPLFVAISR
jgi:(1->4)-alpha-D-glucan 1-alpha-D-glucosylmutase